MGIIVDEFKMKERLVTEGGVTITVIADKSAQDFFLFQMDAPEAKMTENDTRNLVQMIQKVGNPRLGAK